MEKRIGAREIVRNLTFSIRAGEVCGLVGPNGAGKTTTIRLICGLISPTRGRVFIDGIDVQRNRTRAMSRIGVLIDGPSAYPFLTGWQNLCQHARLIGSACRSSDIRSVVDLVGLERRINDKVKAYSLGMRQRLGLAQALLCSPNLLVLDEPTNGMDPSGMREFNELLIRVQSKGTAILVSSHQLKEIEAICTHFMLMKDGCIVSNTDAATLNVGQGICVEVPVEYGAIARELLILAGYHVSSEGAGCVVTVWETQDIASIIAILSNDDVPIRSIGSRKSTLDDWYDSLVDDAQRLRATDQGSGE